MVGPTGSNIKLINYSRKTRYNLTPEEKFLKNLGILINNFKYIPEKTLEQQFQKVLIIEKFVKDHLKYFPKIKEYTSNLKYMYRNLKKMIIAQLNMPHNLNKTMYDHYYLVMNDDDFESRSRLSLKNEINYMYNKLYLASRNIVSFKQYRMHSQSRNRIDCTKLEKLDKDLPSYTVPMIKKRPHTEYKVYRSKGREPKSEYKHEIHSTLSLIYEHKKRLNKM